MNMKNKTGLIALLTFIVILTGCSFEFGPSVVEIVSVETTPADSVLVDGYTYEFEIEVEFSNTTLQELEVWVMFNNYDDPGSYTYIDGATVGVLESGTEYFTVTTTAKDWGSSDDFGIMATLITPEEPLIGKWQAVATDIETIATAPY